MYFFLVKSLNLNTVLSRKTVFFFGTFIKNKIFRFIIILQLKMIKNHHYSY